MPITIFMPHYNYTIYMRFFNILLGLFIFTLTACDESANIGSSIIEDEIEIVMDSTFEVTGHSVDCGKIPSRTVSQLLGIINAKGYGTLSSDVVTQLMPSATIDTTGVTPEDIDSMKLTLYVPLGGYTGDSPNAFAVYIFEPIKSSSE